MAYFANSTEGDYLTQQCEDCPLGMLLCPTLFVQLRFNYAQLREGKEELRQALTILVNDEGVCKTRALLEMLAENVGAAEVTPSLLLLPQDVEP